MPFLTVVGALVVALAGVATLAFRVVQAPRPNAQTPKKEATPVTTPKLPAEHPAMVLLGMMTREFKRHQRALAEARDLRQVRNEALAHTRLLSERVLHAEAARDIARYLRPTSLWDVRRWFKRADLEEYVDQVRDEVRATRVDILTRPLGRVSAWRRFMSKLKGEPETGYTVDLVAYHMTQVEYYSRAVTVAQDLANAGDASGALSQLNTELTTHMWIVTGLGEQYGPGAQPGSGASQPLTRQLTAPSTPINPPESVTP